MTDQTEAMGLPERLRDAEDRFLKWAYKKQYSGPSVISIPRRPGNIDALLAEAADEIERLREAIEDNIAELSERVSEFPRYTCSDIDSAIRAIGPLIKEAYTIEDNEFADRFHDECASLPSDLDDLRNSNSTLRESLSEALQSRKSVAENLQSALEEKT